jgi:CRISPR-associated endoribonuclease Cas6
VFDQFRYVTLEVTMTAEEAAKLPPYKGSTIRGAFGHAFRRVACPFRACPPCILPKTCPFNYVFESPPRDDAGLFGRSSAVPHPFVLELPMDGQTVFSPGEELRFGLLLIGKAIDFLPYFVVALREMGRAGLGRGRGRWHLQRVVDRGPGTPRVLYDGASGDERLLCSATIHRGIERMAVSQGDVKAVTLEFLTPTRLRYVGHLTDKPEFHVLIRNLLRRLSALAFYHCDFELELDHRDLIHQAEGVALRQADLRWMDWERYSARQDARMTLGGFVGAVTFEGDLAPFAPLLRLGEVVHVGKATAFGLGRYRMIQET